MTSGYLILLIKATLKIGSEKKVITVTIVTTLSLFDVGPYY
jgi:hypothetical protein